MLLATAERVEGKRITRVLGLVLGNTVRARGIGPSLMAGLRTIPGGEITELTRLLSESREQALQRMTQQAEAMGANAIVGLRFTTSEAMTSAVELLAYGTAVVVE